MKILRWMFLFIFVLVVEVILSYVLIEIATSKARSRDDIGACIAEKKAEFGIVKSLSVYNFKSEEGFESNYEATFALKGGGVCTSLVTRYDFEKLKEGQKVKAGEASPYYFKIHGVRTQKELIEKYIFLTKKIRDTISYEPWHFSRKQFFLNDYLRILCSGLTRHSQIK